MVPIYQTKIAYRCKWLKIYHHNIDKGVFENEDDALYSIKEGKFSILGLINDKYKIDGKFEFMMEFPNLTNREGMNRWAQIDNPLEIEQVVNENVSEYEPITMSWEYASDVDGTKYPFCGLARSDVSANTLLDGTCTKKGNSGIWHFAIGAFKKQYNKYLPGETNYGKEAILWLRVVNRDNKNIRNYMNTLVFAISMITVFF